MVIGVGKILSAVGHQRKSRNFEKLGANLGQKRIPGDHAENGLVLKGKVSIFNGKPTQTCTFNLTLACLVLRVQNGGRETFCDLPRCKGVQLAQGCKW